MKVTKKSAAKRTPKKSAAKRSTKKAAAKHATKKATPKRSAKTAAGKRATKKAVPKRAVKRAAPKRAVKKAVSKSHVKKAATKRTRTKANRSQKKAGLKSANKSARRQSSGCYFTTACCEYYGLSDNCSQLQTLRYFRDNIMSKSFSGINLIKKYYLVAPSIVQKISASPNKQNEFRIIFNHINKSCELINSGKNEEAIETYLIMVNRLIKKYLNK